MLKFTEKKPVLLLFCLMIYSRIFAIEIKVVYPKEGATISPANKDSTFIFGHVLPADADFEINSEKINLYPNGAFLAYLPVGEDSLTFKCFARKGPDTATLLRKVYVTPVLKTSSRDSLVIEKESILPQKDYRLHQGDLFQVSFKGTPGCRASFTIDGVRENIPMTEENPHREFYWGEMVFGRASPLYANNVKGVYTGSYLIQPMDWRENRNIIFQLLSPAGDTLRAQAPGKLTIFDNSYPQIAELKYDMSVMRTAPACGYYYFLPEGVRLWITGQIGNYVRARLSDTDEAWIESYKVKFLPDGTLPANAVVKVVRTTDVTSKTRVTVFTGERLPFRVQQTVSPQSLQIFFYGAVAYTNWIRHDYKSRQIRDIHWDQLDRDVYKLNIELNQKQQWGYDAFYDGNNHFVIDIKKTPKIAKWPRSPLKNIFILLDPGHSPDTGAIGPTGYTESEANLLLAQTCMEQLEAKGAIVFLTRSPGEGIYLLSRMRLVSMVNPDILISLHHNAVPDGLNPFTNRGTSSYYFHPQSYELARLFQEKLLKRLKLPNFGLYYDNLAMCRPTQMPAVLLEPAFMMFPEEEALIKSEKYRKICSRAIVEALEEFLKKSRE
ncbi:N-acetylmuramoyl-L-alanine amidase [candidate division KSB1 bacterium]|nr:N-acetylmuramoyl-L-alanine amidase [candidate division KSB1 bacterium]